MFRLCICRASDRCMVINDKRKGTVFVPLRTLFPPPAPRISRSRSGPVPHLRARSPRPPLPGPGGCRDRAGGRRGRHGAQPARRPPSPHSPVTRMDSSIVRPRSRAVGSAGAGGESRAGRPGPQGRGHGGGCGQRPGAGQRERTDGRGAGSRAASSTQVSEGTRRGPAERSSI